jgi:1,2-dihydroxy-3-keto-5-methylthiopentene dioxygenase
VDPAYLSQLGILHYHYPNVSDVDAIASQRQYKNRDEITISPTTMGDVYEEKVKTFFHEHLHEDEEIRYILDGGGFFDVRGEGDDWVRIKLEKGDLMIMPAGIYHRFTTDEQNVSGDRDCLCCFFGVRILIFCSIQRLCGCSRRIPSGHP